MMNAKRLSVLLPILLVSLLVSLVLAAACSAPLPGQPPAESTITAATAAIAAPAGAAAARASDVAAACPQPTEGTALYVSEENDFCFLYPSDLQLRPHSRFPQDAVQLTGAPLDLGAMESFVLNLGVSYNGPADGLDSAEYAATWMELPGGYV